MWDMQSHAVMMTEELDESNSTDKRVHIGDSMLDFECAHLSQWRINETKAAKVDNDELKKAISRMALISPVIVWRL